MEGDRIEGAAAGLAAHSKDAHQTGDSGAAPDNAFAQADSLAAQAKAAATRAGGALADTARKVGFDASEIGAEVYEKGARATRYVGQTVEQRPGAGLLVAGAIGYFLGFLVHRRR